MYKSITTLTDVKASYYDLSSSNLDRLKEQLQTILHEEQIIEDPEECFKCSHNDWAHAEKSQRPALVVQPRTTEDVSSILKIACRLHVPVTSCSGRTSVTGSIISTRGGLCVDFQNMAKILAVHKEDLDAVVQPGVGWRELHEELDTYNLFFPPDPGPGACIGGMIGTSCAGTNAYRFGTMKEWVIALTVVLADGSVVTTKRRPRKSANGYDLTHLIIGSEGTLGLVTEAVIKLAPVPVNQHVAIATFNDLRSAMKTGLSLTQSGLQPDALELLDHNSMKSINKAQMSGRRWSEKPTLFLKISGPGNSANNIVGLARKEAEKHGCLKFEATLDPQERSVLWDARKFVSVAFYETRDDPEASYLVSDSAVPLSRVVDLMHDAYDMLDKAGVPGAFTVHLGDGNVHCKVLGSPSKLDIARKLVSDIELRAVDLDGTISGEHGIGFKHRDELEYELGKNAVGMMRTIKLALDPARILNPDKVLRLDASI